MWVQIGEREEICESGLLRITESGHGVLKGMYRKPVLLDGKPYYRYSVDGKPKWTLVKLLVKEHFNVDVEPDKYWYKLVKHLVAKHNTLMKMNYALEYDQLESERRSRRRKPAAQPRGDEILHDLFQNDIIVDCGDWGNDEQD
jgi:hypothetical protein